MGLGDITRREVNPGGRDPTRRASLDEEKTLDDLGAPAGKPSRESMPKLSLEDEIEKAENYVADAARRVLSSKVGIKREKGYKEGKIASEFFYWSAFRWWAPVPVKRRVVRVIFNNKGGPRRINSYYDMCEGNLYGPMMDVADRLTRETGLRYEAHNLKTTKYKAKV